MVNPYQDLGEDPKVAWLAAGWKVAVPPPMAKGFVYLRNEIAVRANPEDSLRDIRKIAAAASAEIGETIGIAKAQFLIGDKVVYQGIERLVPAPVETLLAHAFAATELILSNVFKAKPILDPTKPGNRAIIIRQLADSMVAEARAGEMSAVRAGRKILDANWPKLKKAEADELIKQAANRIKTVPVKVVPGIRETISIEQKRIMRGARKAAIQRHKLQISPNLTLVDQKSIRAAQDTSVKWLTNEYGNRAELFERDAQLIVEEGLKRGLGRSDIAEDLDKRLTAAGLGRSESYYQVYAASLVDRSRTRSELNSYRMAEIVTWIASATLDEVTSDYCRWVDGKVFNVEQSISLMDSAEKPGMSAESMKAANPWIKMIQRKDGLTATANGKSIFTVDKSGIGTQRSGSYTEQYGADRLGSLGIGPPPYHGRCRTMTVADIRMT